MTTAPGSSRRLLPGRGSELGTRHPAEASQHGPGLGTGAHLWPRTKPTLGLRTSQVYSPGSNSGAGGGRQPGEAPWNQHRKQAALCTSTMVQRSSCLCCFLNTRAHRPGFFRNLRHPFVRPGLYRAAAGSRRPPHLHCLPVGSATRANTNVLAPAYATRPRATSLATDDI